MEVEEGRDELLVIYVQLVLYDSANQLRSVKGQYFILKPAYERKLLLSQAIKHNSDGQVHTVCS